jgi:hypothetical protein
VKRDPLQEPPREDAPENPLIGKGPPAVLGEATPGAEALAKFYDDAFAATIEPMETANMGGRHIVLIGPQGEHVEAIWHSSRHFEKMRWVSDGWWKESLTGKRVPFEPIGWRAL